MSVRLNLTRILLIRIYIISINYQLHNPTRQRETPAAYNCPRALGTRLHQQRLQQCIQFNQEEGIRREREKDADPRRVQTGAECARYMMPGGMCISPRKMGGGSSCRPASAECSGTTQTCEPFQYAVGWDVECHSSSPSGSPLPRRDVIEKRFARYFMKRDARVLPGRGGQDYFLNRGRAAIESFRVRGLMGSGGGFVCSVFARCGIFYC